MNIHESVTVLWKRLQGDGVGAIVARGASYSLAVMVIGVVMAFGTNLLLARLMGATQYGIYIYTLTWINLLVLVCQLGMPTSLLRFVSAYNAKNEWGLLRGLLSRSIQFILLASFLIGVTASIAVWLIYDRIGSDQAITFWIALLLLPLLGLTGLRSASLRALKRVFQAALPDSLIRPLLITILVSAFYIFSKQHLQASQVMVFNLIGALVAFFIGTLWLIKALPEQLPHIPSVYAGWHWLKVSLPLFFSSGMHLLLKQTDILMVGVFIDTKQAGIYAVASRIAGLVALVGVAFGNIVAPMISELFSTNRRIELQRMMTLAAFGIFTSALFMSFGLAVLGKYILALFGEEFVNGYILLVILLISYLINSFFGSGGFLMSMTKYENQHALIIGSVVIVNILANVILLSLMGVIGAAIATLISRSLWNIIMLVYVWRWLNINPTILAWVGRK